MLRPSRADIQFVDFDSVRFHISTPEAKTVLLLSMSIQCWPDLEKYGARQSLEAMYAGYILPEAQTEAEYNVSLSIDLERIPSDPGEAALLGSLTTPSPSHSPFGPNQLTTQRSAPSSSATCR